MRKIFSSAKQTLGVIRSNFSHNVDSRCRQVGELKASQIPRVSLLLSTKILLKIMLQGSDENVLFKTIAVTTLRSEQRFRRDTYIPVVAGREN